MNQKAGDLNSSLAAHPKTSEVLGQYSQGHKSAYTSQGSGQQTLSAFLRLSLYFCCCAGNVMSIPCWRPYANLPSKQNGSVLLDLVLTNTAPTESRSGGRGLLDVKP